jgi:hypothetical protein
LGLDADEIMAKKVKKLKSVVFEGLNDYIIHYFSDVAPFN